MKWESLGGCDRYIVGQAEIKIALPAKATTCQYCSFISYHPAYERHYCKLTDEWLLNWKKERGAECPVKWEVASEKD